MRREDEGREMIRPLVLDGAWSKGMEALTSGVVLAGLALHLGAGPFLIGVVAAAPFLAQFAQFAGLRVVFRVGDRRRVSLASAFASRLLLAGVGIIAWQGPSPWALPSLVALLSLSGALSAVSAVSWAFWMRDLIPQHVYGDRLGRRFAAQAVVSVVVTLLAGAWLTYCAGKDMAGLGFAVLFLAGAASGMLGLVFTARLPEAPINPADVPPTVLGLLRGVSRGARRDVVLFSAAWTFAAFLSAPFVMVYLLRVTGLSFAVVSALTALAMCAGLVTFRFWGRNADRFGAGAVLGLAVPVAAVCVGFLASAAGAGWRLVPLSILFALNGAAFAAVDVGVAKLVAQRAPFTGAGTFLAGVGILRALAAGAATILGGLAAAWLGSREFCVTVGWGEGELAGAASGYVFLFAASAFLMLYAWHRVLALRGKTEGHARDVLHEAQVEIAGLAPFRGARLVGHFAGHVASHVLERRHTVPAEEEAAGASSRSPRMRMVR